MIISSSLPKAARPDASGLYACVIAANLAFAPEVRIDARAGIQRLLALLSAGTCAARHQGAALCGNQHCRGFGGSDPAGRSLVDDPRRAIGGIWLCLAEP